jgi:hypothetical protein
MNEIEIIRKEIPPITVSDLASELEVLSELADRWLKGGSGEEGAEAFRQIIAHLHPRLLKALVMIAQKETSSILKTRKKTTLTCLGAVAIHGSGAVPGRKWVDVFIAEDRTPLLRRVEVSAEGLSFHGVSWAGWATISCTRLESWNPEKKFWTWDSAAGDEAVGLLRDKVLPRLPLRVAVNAACAVPDWPRHLEFVSVQSLLRAVDSLGEGEMGEAGRARVVDLLEAANADLNPLWTHLLRENEGG